MLLHDEVDTVARVVVARVLNRADTLDRTLVDAAYGYLRAVPEAECHPELDQLIAEVPGDLGTLVEMRVRRLLVNGAAVAWPLLQRVIELCPPDRSALGTIGAGMFEDWVSEDRVRLIEDELRQLLRSDARWRVVTEASWDEPPSLVRLLADPENLPPDPL